ncbi:MAG: hypothetical protein HC888_08275 [Candidatus Competibacteraceae bacterium]|nr:hypothetical protein [Candidatus Competibacteraceae bacterium]
MSNRESEEKGDLRLAGSPEGLAMRSADAQAARSAGVSDVKAAQDTNPNKHNGSAGGDQLESIQIIALDDGGKQKVLAERPKEAKPKPEITPEYLREKAKQPDIWAQKFVVDMDKAEKLPAPYKDAQIAKVLKDAEAVYRPRGQAEKPQAPLDQMDTGTLLAHEVRRNPAAEPVQNLHTWAKQLPEGPEKDRYSQLVREQMAELSPEAKARAERLAQVSEKIKAAGLDEGGVHQALKPDQLVLQASAQHQENEWEAFTKLDPKQQRGIVEAFQKASNISQSSYENQIQAVAESIPRGFYNVGKGLYDSGIAAGTFMIEAADRPEKLPEAAQKLAENLSTALMSGLKISEVIAGYSQEVAQSGDYSRPLRDLQILTTLANERWEAMPLEKRTEKGSELIAEMGVGSVIGAADKLAKSGKLIDALEDLAKYAGELTAPGREKARRALVAFLDDVFQPKGLTTNGFEMPIPKQQRDIDDLVMLKNKGLPDHVKPSEQVTTRRQFSPKGEAIHRLDVPETVFEAAEARGLSRQVVAEKLNKVADALTDAYNTIGDYNPKIHGSERSYGIRLHELLRRSLGRDDLIQAEASYKKGLPVPWGKLGSSRVDIALGEYEKPFASMCLKTLRASPSAQQERGWFKNLPRFEDDSVIPRIYFKLGK